VKSLILDCFVDEPACFGVPPFVSPYPRYIFGALIDAGESPDSISYMTIETLRTHNLQIDGNYSAVFLVGGAVVPGKYLGHRIGTYREIVSIIQKNPSLFFAAGGLVGRLLSKEHLPNATALAYDIEHYAFSLAAGAPEDKLRTYDTLDRWSILGAAVVSRHSDFPDVIAEIETYRGCPRSTHCSFCSEHIFDTISFRSVDAVSAEIDALIAQGVTRFRIGRQADILAYGSAMAEYRNGFPRPEPDAVAALFKALKERRDEGKIKVLCIDNANPGTIANFPEESEKAIAAIADAITPGDTMPLGIESFDPEVFARNNLKVNLDQALDVVRIINRAGGIRRDGVPVLLPGINLIHGLPGETKETFRINYDALCRIRDEGLLLKRINIRTLSPFPGTAAAENPPKMNAGLVNRYEYYRDKIRDEIDHVMLGRIYPEGTLLRGQKVIDTLHDYSFARPLQSYAITLKIPQKLEVGRDIDCVVTGQRERSISALELPVRINSLSPRAIESIPGVGKKAASDIILAKPILSQEQLLKIAPSFSKEILQFVTFA
jgi:radical SAM superfamily enzyme with C-terminal helix-hairpin-helix motif